MKREIRIYLLAVIVWIPAYNLFAQELRLGVDFDRTIHPRLEILSKVQVRKSFHSQDAFYSIAQAGLKYKISKQISMAGSLRYSLVPNNFPEIESSSFQDKLRYTAETKFNSKSFTNGMRLSYRIRYQHSKTKKGNNKDYLRNKLIVQYKLNKEVQPYMAVELYFRFKENELQRFRLYLGSDFKLFSKEAELSYILEGDIDDEYFQSFHMFGLFLKL